MGGEWLESFCFVFDCFFFGRVYQLFTFICYISYMFILRGHICLKLGGLSILKNVKKKLSKPRSSTNGCSPKQHIVGGENMLVWLSTEGDKADFFSLSAGRARGYRCIRLF